MIIRNAKHSEVNSLNTLIANSARKLCQNDYTTEEIEAAIAFVFGVDTELLTDETYYVVENNGEIAACGGWSKRKTLFGGNQCNARETGYLNPKIDAAKIRAFFVHPDYARHGLGKLLLAHCEKQAALQGFYKLEMMATLTGAKLYQTQGYKPCENKEYPLPNGIILKFIRMQKDMPKNVEIMTSSFSFFSTVSKNAIINEVSLDLNPEKNSNAACSVEAEKQTSFLQPVNQAPDQFFKKEGPAVINSMTPSAYNSDESRISYQ